MKKTHLRSLALTRRVHSSVPLFHLTLVLSLRGNEKRGNWRDNEGYGGEFQATHRRSVIEVFLAPGITHG